MKKFSIVAAAILMTATGALAEEPNADAAAQQEKKICKNEKITGSLTRVRRTCMTAAQWAQVASATQNATSEFVRRSGNNQSPGRGQTLSAD